MVLLEQGKLTCGTTWHAAGLVGQTRATRNATRMSRYGIDLYASLERETGLATGWKACGSLNVAKTPERMQLIRRQMARAKSFGVEFEVVTPADAGRIAPILRTDDLTGGVWIPGDGKANPADLTQSLAKGARMRGARIVEGACVTGVRIHNGRVAGVAWDAREPGGDARGDIACEVVVNCGGQWAREVAAQAGVVVPLVSVQHQYLITEPIPGVPRCMHSDGCPVRQGSHSPHRGDGPPTMWSPTFHSVTPLPMATTTPLHSWPSTEPFRPQPSRRPHSPSPRKTRPSCGGWTSRAR